MTFRWKPYVPVAARRGAIAGTFWGKAWCQNLERYSDYANRLPRGRTYLRNGSVINLEIATGTVVAQVMGSSLYRVEVNVAAVPARQWKGIARDCAQSIDSLVELLQGRLSTSVMERITRPGTGLFPSPKEITFSCSCPDWAAMCKHVAATLYGVGARLDAQPDLLFTLREVDAQELIARAGESVLPVQKAPRANRILDASKMTEVFGIDLAGSVTTRSPARPPVKPIKKAPSRRQPKKASPKRKAARRTGR